MRRSRRAVIPFSIAVALAAGCGDQRAESEQPQSPAPAAPAQVAFLTPTQHLVRASMTLRGLRPSVEDLRAVDRDPAALPAIVDRYLHSREFGDTIRDIHDEALKVRVDTVSSPAAFPARGPLANLEVQKLNESVLDAPLRLVQDVVENDRPYSEIVTADYTVADGVVSKVWGIPYEGDGTEWRRTRYVDGREHAGILSDSYLFTRHSTTYSNANRGRANAISTALLCYNFLDRDISIDATINLADPEEVADATRKNAACASCHQTLDPLAAYFAGFRPQYTPSFEDRYPIVFDTEPLAKVFSKAEPSYFGSPGRGLRYLGSMIAADPRFSMCAAKRFYSYFTQVPLERVPLAQAAALQTEFIAKNLDARALARAIVLSDDFRTSHSLAAPDATNPPDESTAHLRKLRPRELAHLIEDLTGLSWQTEFGHIAEGTPYDAGRVGHVNLLTDSFFGYSVLFGGTDGFYVTRPSHSMNATAVSVLRTTAWKAADLVVDTDLRETDRSKRRLLVNVELGPLAEAAVREQIAALHARMFGALDAPDSDEVNATYTLFRDALAESNGDTQRAWKLVVFGMLQDPRIVFY